MPDLAADVGVPGTEATGPELKGAPGTEVTLLRDEPAERLTRLAASWMYRGGARGEDEAWLERWVAEDPSRLVELVHALLSVERRHTPTQVRPRSWTYHLRRLGEVFRTLLRTWKVDLVSPLRARLEEGAGTDVQRAAYMMALGAMAPRSTPALPVLHKMLAAASEFDQTTLYLPFAIVSIAGGTDDVVPLLGRILRSPERPIERGYDNHLLGRVIPQMGPYGKRLAPALADYIARNDVSSGLRWSAVKLLSHFPMDLDTRRRAVVAALEKNDSRFPSRAITLLEGLSAEDLLPVIPALEKATELARVNGVSALLRAGVDGKLLGYLVLPCLQSKGQMVRDRAVRLLPMTVKDVDDVLPIARAMLTGRDPRMWVTATRALGALTSVPGDRAAVTRELVTCVESRDASVRRVAVQSLLMFDDQSAAIVSMLGELLRDDDVTIRAEAVDALGELSAHEPTARAALERALGDSDERVRSVAEYWLKEDDD